MYQRDKNKQRTAVVGGPLQPTASRYQIQGAPPIVPSQPSTMSQLSDLALNTVAGKAINKGANLAEEKGTELLKSGYDKVMGSAFMNPAAAEAASTYGLGAEAALGSGSQAAMLAAQDAAFGGSLAAAAPTAATGAATGGAAAGGGMMAGMATAMPYVGAALVADELLGLNLRKNILGFANGGKVYAAYGKKVYPMSNGPLSQDPLASNPNYFSFGGKAMEMVRKATGVSKGSSGGGLPRGNSDGGDVNYMNILKALTVQPKK
jgi:hypothetical protein